MNIEDEDTTLVDSQNNIIHKDYPPLWQQIKEDFHAPQTKDPACKNFTELFFNYPGVVAIIHYRIAHRLYKKGLRLFARALMGITQFVTRIDIHPGAYIGRGVFIDHGVGVVIGESAQIGNDVTIYQGVNLGGTSLAKTKRHPTVLHNVIIGAGAKILGNILVGKNTRIGSNSVVIRDVPDNATAVGIPARNIQKNSTNTTAEQTHQAIDDHIMQFILYKTEILESIVQSLHNGNGLDSELLQKYEKLKMQENELNQANHDILKTFYSQKM